MLTDRSDSEPNPKAGHGADSLGVKARLAARWAIAGQAASYGLRLVSGVVLAWLLFPEAFGIAAIVGAFLFGLHMFSDVGIGPSIVQNQRGDDADFLNTAWTMQIVRGIGISLAAALLSWPIANFYEQSELGYLLIVSGLSAGIEGLMSTSVHTQRRHLRQAALVRLELAAQVCGTTVTIIWALASPSVWALVGGTITASIVKTLLSHTWLPHFSHRLRWETSSRQSLIRFGRWIFLSSALTCVAVQVDRLILGHYLGLIVLGVYSVATRFTEALGGLQIRLIHSVVFPFLSQTGRSDPRKISSTYYRVRLRVDTLFLPMSAFLFVFGEDVVRLLYDTRYHEAGWILQMLSLVTASQLILCSHETLLVALGHSRFAFLTSLLRAIWIAAAAPASFLLWGAFGLVASVALINVLPLALCTIGMLQRQLLNIRRELFAALIATVSIAGFTGLRSILGVAGW